MLDIVHHQIGQRTHVGGHQGNALGAECLQTVDQGACRSHHGGQALVGARHRRKIALDLPVIAPAHRHDGDQARRAHHVHAGIRQFGRAAQTFLVHGLQFFLRHLVHAHAAGMKGEALRMLRLAGAQHGRDLRFHRGVGTRHDLADAESAGHGNVLPQDSVKGNPGVLHHLGKALVVSAHGTRHFSRARRPGLEAEAG